MKRTHELDEQSTVDLDTYVPNDKPGWSNTLKIKLQTIHDYFVGLFGDADTAIKDGAGLDSDGAFTPPVGAEFIETADFVAAGLDVNMKNALALLDAKLKSVNNSVGATGTTVTRVFKIRAAQAKTLNSAPVTLIAHPGTAKAIDVVHACALNSYAGGALNCGASTLNLLYVTNDEIVTAFSNDLLEATARFVESATINSNPRRVYEEDSLAVATAADDTGGTYTGDLYIAITYNILTWANAKTIVPGEETNDNPDIEI